MARTATAIQTEITALENQIAMASTVASTESNGKSFRLPDLAVIQKRLTLLYRQLGNLDGTQPMVIRGRPTGLDPFLNSSTS